MPLSDIEAVMWDMDGVLVDSERLVQAVFVEVMSQGGPISWLPAWCPLKSSRFGLARKSRNAGYDRTRPY